MTKIGTGRPGTFLPAILFSMLGLISALAFMVAPPALGETTVVFAPDISEAEAWAHIRAAGGYVVGPTALPFAYVAYAADADFAWRVFSRGGLPFAADARLCGPALEQGA